MAKVYDQNRQVHEVPDEEVLDYLRQGYRVKKSDTFVVTDGVKYGTIKGEKLPNIQNTGWRLASQSEVQERRYGNENLAAAALGGLRALTLGASDAGLSALGMSEDYLEGVKAANPVMSGLGEVAGTVGSFLIGTGEAKAAATLGKGAAKAAGLVDDAARLAETAAATAGKTAQAVPTAAELRVLQEEVVGASSGWLNAGRAAGEATRAITQFPRMVAKLGYSIAGETEGAILKAATGVGLSAESKLLQGTARVFGLAAGGTAEGAIYGFGQGISEAALGDYKTAGEALHAVKDSVYSGAEIGGWAGGIFGTGAELLRPVTRYAQKKFANTMTRAALAADAEMHAELGRQIGLTPRQMGKFADDRGEEWVKDFRMLMEEPGLTPDMPEPIFLEINRGLPRQTRKRAEQVLDYHGKVLGSTREFLDQAAEAATANGNRRVAWGDIAAEVEARLSAGEGLFRVTKLNEAAGPLEETFFKRFNALVQEPEAGGFLSLQQLHAKREQISRWIDSARSANQGELAHAFATANGVIRDVEAQIVERELKAFGEEGLARLKQYEISRNIYRTLKGPIKQGSPAFKEEVGGAAKGAIDYAAQALRWQVLGGSSLSRLAWAATRRAAVGVATSAAKQAGVQWAKSAEGALKLAQVAEMLTQGQRHLNNVLPAAVSHEMRKKFTRRVMPAMEFLTLAGGNEDPNEAVDNLHRQALQFQADPASHMRRASASVMGLETDAPNVHQEYLQTSARMAQEITKIITPKPAHVGLQPELPKELQYKRSQQQLNIIARNLQAVLDPMAALERVASGEITRGEWEHLKAVYPAMAAKIEAQLAVAASLSDVPQDAVARATLKKLLGDKALPAYSAQAIAAAQAIYKKQREARPAGGPGKAGRGGLDIADSFATVTQKLQSGVA